MNAVSISTWKVAEAFPSLRNCSGGMARSSRSFFARRGYVSILLNRYENQSSEKCETYKKRSLLFEVVPGNVSKSVIILWYEGLPVCKIISQLLARSECNAFVF